ncbi:MAG: hypothetical protein WBA74_08200 [Cyclobacteriaceae bacterium]
MNAQITGSLEGEISEEEWQMQSYEKDPEAGAVVIYDQGDVRFKEIKGRFVVDMKRQRRLKIFSRNEAGQSEIAIPY